MKMHKDQVQITDKLVKSLVLQQFPQYKSLPLQKVNSTGTVNAIYKLGDELCIRLPMTAWANDSLQTEFNVLPIISKSVSITVPNIIEKGHPSSDFPFNWAIYNWIPGAIYNNAHAHISETETAKTLAKFIQELRMINTEKHHPKAGRLPLQQLDEATTTAISNCKGDIDTESALQLWQKLLTLAPWDNKPVWIHADLLKPNLLVYGGKLSAIIDFGSAGIGDPAFDIVPAWATLTSKSRQLFKNLLAVDNDTWLRAKAYALHQAVLIIPYYRESNPEFSKMAICTVNNILSDLA